MSKAPVGTVRLVAPQRLRIENDVITRISRNLKGKGQLNVLLGQEVSPPDILGSCQISAGFRTINLATLLSVSPKDVSKYLKRAIGQKIYKDELLAFRQAGLLHGKKVVTAPTDGIVDFLNSDTGELKMTFLPKKVDLPAAVFGVVEKVDSAHGQVVLRTQVTKVFGVFGTGRGRDGILEVLGSREDLIRQSMISPKYSEHILFGGSLIYKEAITAAISAAISGIITGGINAQDFSGMAGGRIVFPKKLDNDIGISMVICEGFGSIPIGADIYQTLLKYEGKFVLIDGNQARIYLPSFESDSMRRVRSTKLPPISDDTFIKADNEPKVSEIKVGEFVRVVGSSFLGEQGRIIAIDNSKSLLPSGIRTYLLTIETKRRKIQVPFSNVEVLAQK